MRTPCASSAIDRAHCHVTLAEDNIHHVLNLLGSARRCLVKGGADVLVANDNTDWINKKWRPVMGWIYMLTCTMDFVIFPILWSLLQAMSKGSVTMQWQPLTLQS